MHLVTLVMMVLPLTAGPVLPAQVNLASEGVNRHLSVAVELAAADTPAWEDGLRAELADSPVYAGKLCDAIRAAAEETGIDPAMLWSVAWAETHGRHSHADGRVKRGSHGEVGLMQIRPFWQRALKRVYGLEVDLFDLADNVRAGAYILKRGGDEPAVMLSYYNTGKQLKSCSYSRKVMKYLKQLGADGTPAQVMPAAHKPAAQQQGGAASAEPAQSQTQSTGNAARWGRSWRERN